MRDLQDQTVAISTTSQISITIGDLIPGTEYKLSVAGITSAGIGALSENTVVSTDEEGNNKYAMEKYIFLLIFEAQ